MSKVSPVIEKSWKAVLADEFGATYFLALKDYLISEKEKFLVYPPGSLIFSAFNLTPFDDVKVVLLGQDPYHGSGQAHGLCFSVPDGISQPPSLQNIFKELHDDLGLPVPRSGNLENWARQGVLLLNATLTVRAHQAGSHQNRGWEEFTDAAIRKLSNEKEHLVFLLWGNYAIAKENMIDRSKHLILKSPHPSPFSANRGFFGNRHFSKTNAWLRSHNISEINWSLT